MCQFFVLSFVYYLFSSSLDSWPPYHLVLSLILMTNWFMVSIAIILVFFLPGLLSYWLFVPIPSYLCYWLFVYPVIFLYFTWFSTCLARLNWYSCYVLFYRISKIYQVVYWHQLVSPWEWEIPHLFLQHNQCHLVTALQSHYTRQCPCQRYSKWSHNHVCLRFLMLTPFY